VWPAIELTISCLNNFSNTRRSENDHNNEKLHTINKSKKEKEKNSQQENITNL